MKKILIIILIAVTLAVSSLVYASDYIETIVASVAKSKYVGSKGMRGMP